MLDEKIIEMLAIKAHKTWRCAVNDSGINVFDHPHNKPYEELDEKAKDCYRKMVCGMLNTMEESGVAVIDVCNAHNHELACTAVPMVSGDYKKRFWAECIQLKNRYEGLKRMCEKWDKGELEFTPTCPRWLYEKQLAGMSVYLEVLEKRDLLEGVDVWGRLEAVRSGAVGDGKE